MRQPAINADDLVSSLLRLSKSEQVCLLDSCGVGHLGSHLMVAGIDPVEIIEITNDDPSKTLDVVDKKLSGDLAAIFTVSYEFGQKLLGVKSREKEYASRREPDVFIALFNAFVVHDYSSGQTELVGNGDRIASNSLFLSVPDEFEDHKGEWQGTVPTVRSNFTEGEYLAAIEAIKEHIRDGNTYQTNLTQRLTAHLPTGLTPELIFSRLRRDHPAPFAAYIKRPGSTVVSASPERFFRVSGNTIETSPIKGTRRRGMTAVEDENLRDQLITSSKDRAENTMIVDLLRNDLGRLCDFGSIRVDKLCDLEVHPTLFHLVSTISGTLRDELKFSDILRSVFPCGSITGAPKLSTMKIIDEIESASRGLSMGAIGYYVPPVWNSGLATYDLSVAIRTMVIRDDLATFNVGGGITNDSEPTSEYAETMLKAKALLTSLGCGGTI